MTAPATPRSFSPLGAVLLTAFALAVCAITAASIRDAARRVGAPSPQLFVDPYGRFSAVRLPTWGAPSPTLRYTDALLSIDGERVPDDARVAGRAGALLADRCRGAARAGRTSIDLVFARGATSVTVTRPVAPTTVNDVAPFLLLYHAASLLLLWVGVAVLLLSPHRVGGYAFALWALGVSLFFATFIDYHLSARLRALFSLASGWLLVGLALLIYAFPDAPRARVRLARRILFGVLAASALLTTWGVVGPPLGLDAFAARMCLGNGVAVALLALAAALFARFRSAQGAERDELRSALLGFTLAPLLITGGFAALSASGAATVHFFLPLLTSVMPMAIGWALVRHNVLGANALLTRRIMVFPMLLVALVAAIGLWLTLRTYHTDDQARMVSAVTAVGVFSALVALLRRVGGRALFPATAEFRPTIEQLAESIADLGRREDIERAMERTVTRWLPSGRVVLLRPAEVDQIVHLGAADVARVRAGEKAWTAQPPKERHLVVPLRSHGVLRGVLDIAPKHQGAIFTDEDIALLDTIAMLGALALHNVENLQALDAVRRLEVDASREDKRLTLGLLGAELSPALAHPLQFFRGVLRRSVRRPIDPEDVEIGGEELSRMERMLASLRSLEPIAPHITPVALSDAVARALVLVRERVAERGLLSEVSLPEGCIVLADADGLVQVFANLLRNATQAAHGALGVRAQAGGEGLTVDVWDDGAGVPDELVDKLFHRWVTSRAKDGGMGLGLSVAQRLIESFDWKIAYHREGGRTCFRVLIPREKIASSDT